MAANQQDPSRERPRLLTTTEPLVVPVDTTVRVLVTSSDVIHSFAVPSFGIKEDAIQGRVNETWFRVKSSLIGDQEYFYGQCSELCGKDHAFMPIEIRVVSRDEFNQWVAANGGAVAVAAPAPAPEPEAPPRAGPRRLAPARLQDNHAERASVRARAASHWLGTSARLMLAPRTDLDVLPRLNSMGVARGAGHTAGAVRT